MEDLAVFIKELGLEQPYIFGYDSGGLVTLMLASQQPDILGKAVVAGVFIDGRGIHKYHYLTEGVRRFLRFDRDSRVEYVQMSDDEQLDDGPPHVDVKDARIERRPLHDYDTTPIRLGFA